MIPAGVHALMRVRAFTSEYMHVRVSACVRACVTWMGVGVTPPHTSKEYNLGLVFLHFSTPPPTPTPLKKLCRDHLDIIQLFVHVIDQLASLLQHWASPEHSCMVLHGLMTTRTNNKEQTTKSGQQHLINNIQQTNKQTKTNKGFLWIWRATSCPSPFRTPE